VSSKLDYYFFVKSVFARMIIAFAGLGLAIFFDVYLKGFVEFWEQFDPISAFLIRGVFCLFVGMLFFSLLSLIYNFFEHVFKKNNSPSKHT